MKENNALFTKQNKSLKAEISDNWHLVYMLTLWGRWNNLGVDIDIIMYITY